jgi:hypothetical protein
VLTLNQPDYSLYDTNRLWVTLERGTVPERRDYISPANLRIVNNTLIILQEVLPTDGIVITSMVPSASPDQVKFRISVDRADTPTVHRENQFTRTYVDATMITTLTDSDQIQVHDASKLVETTTYANMTIVSGLIDGVLTNYIDITNTGGIVVTASAVALAGTTFAITDYVIQTINYTTIRLIFSTTIAGTVVDVTMSVGNTVIIQSEEIVFTSINLMTGVISGLQRGQNGTIVNKQIDQYSVVQAVSKRDLLAAAYYTQDWYASATYTQVSVVPDQWVGDNTIPLQLSSGVMSDFLNSTVI